MIVFSLRISAVCGMWYVSSSFVPMLSAGCELKTCQKKLLVFSSANLLRVQKTASFAFQSGADVLPKQKLWFSFPVLIPAALAPYVSSFSGMFVSRQVHAFTSWWKIHTNFLKWAKKSFFSVACFASHHKFDY